MVNEVEGLNSIREEQPHSLHIVSAGVLPRTGLSLSVTSCSKQLRQPKGAEKVLLETTICCCNTTEIFKLSYSLFIRHY